MAEEYLAQLQNLQKGLMHKETIYSLEIGMGEEYLKELESINTYVGKVGTAINNNNKEEREHCECNVF